MTKAFPHFISLMDGSRHWITDAMAEYVQSCLVSDIQLITLEYMDRNVVIPINQIVVVSIEKPAKESTDV